MPSNNQHNSSVLDGQGGQGGGDGFAATCWSGFAPSHASLSRPSGDHQAQGGGQ
jgi:hypothetical protein